MARTRAPPGLEERLEEKERELFEVQEETARQGPATRALSLRALLQQHKDAYTAFLKLFQQLARLRAEADLMPVWGWASTHLLTEVYALGKARSEAAKWRLDQELESLYFFRRLTDRGVQGEAERIWTARYVAKNFVFPAFEALWRQLGGAEQEPTLT
jgi:hypothetical protein